MDHYIYLWRATKQNCFTTHEIFKPQCNSNNRYQNLGLDEILLRWNIIFLSVAQNILGQASETHSHSAYQLSELDSLISSMISLMIYQVVHRGRYAAPCLPLLHSCFPIIFGTQKDIIHKFMFYYLGFTMRYYSFNKVDLEIEFYHGET